MIDVQLYFVKILGCAIAQQSISYSAEKFFRSNPKERAASKRLPDILRRS